MIQNKFLKSFLALAFVSNLPSAEAFLFRKCDLRDKESLTLKSFDRCSQDQLDEFYRGLEAGETIPNGEHKGSVQIARPSDKNFSIRQAIRRLFPNVFRESEEFLLERVWGGKIFYRKNPNEGTLTNRVFRRGEGFPAHVYYGQSLFDPSKLSIVIDYEFNEDIPGYNPRYDWLVNHRGVAVRDEIRKVNDGLYLGRAYLRKKFFVNFIIESLE